MACLVTENAAVMSACEAITAAQAANPISGYKAQLGAIFTQLATQVAGDLQRKGYVGRTIGIKLRFEDFKTVTRDLSIELPTSDAATIRLAAGLCLKRVDLARRIRLLGVRVGNLQRAPGAGPARPAA